DVVPRRAVPPRPRAARELLRRVVPVPPPRAAPAPRAPDAAGAPSLAQFSLARDSSVLSEKRELSFPSVLPLLATPPQASFRRSGTSRADFDPRVFSNLCRSIVNLRVVGWGAAG